MAKCAEKFFHLLSLPARSALTRKNAQGCKLRRDIEPDEITEIKR